MPREKKTEIIDRLKDTFSRCNIAILTDYRGLTMAEMTNLRRRLQESGNEFKVVKNTLARLAAIKAGKDELASLLIGPVAIALGYGDIASPAKALASYISEARGTITIKGAFSGDRLLTAEEVITLSTLPSKEILVAKLLGQMKSPLAVLIGSLTAPMRGIVAVLQARIRQMEGN